MLDERALYLRRTGHNKDNPRVDWPSRGSKDLSARPADKVPRNCPSISSTISLTQMLCSSGINRLTDLQSSLHQLALKKKKKEQPSFQTQRQQHIRIFLYEQALHNRAVTALGKSNQKDVDVMNLRAPLGRPCPTFCYQVSDPRRHVCTIGLAGKLPTFQVLQSPVAEHREWGLLINTTYLRPS